MSASRVLLKVALLVCGLMILITCVPHPMSRKDQNPTGALASPPDPSRIEVGVTTRIEVMREFGAINTGLISRRVFFGRWAHSSMGVSGDRLWRESNLLVKYDKAGVVERFKLCGDDEFVKVASSYLDAATLSEETAAPVEEAIQVFGLNGMPLSWDWTKVRIAQDTVTIQNLVITGDQVGRILALPLPEQEYSHPNKFSLQLTSKGKHWPPLQMLMSARTAAVIIAVLEPGRHKA